ncbi:MAG: class I SAM-dependent methyltransferase [Planctomycetota bacterium]
MPTLEENLSYWQTYNWSDGGEEWTRGFGGPDLLWSGVVYPRVRAYLPAEHVLELAPGHGLWTEFLRPKAKRMTLVDLAPVCIEACQKRYGDEGMTYHVNDGRDLSMVPDESIDFCFSLHSLVHAEADVMEAYVRQLARVLTPGGMAFLHHSNIEPYIEHFDTSGPQPDRNEHWRGRDMSGEKMLGFVEEAGMTTLVQERIKWGGPHLIDAYTLFGRMPSIEGGANVFDNPEFWPRVGQTKVTAEVYAGVRR